MNELKVQWNLGNTCSLDCSYCHIELKDGTNPFPGIARFRPAFAHLIEQARAFSLIKIDIPGGEPTESHALKELMLENTSPAVQFKISSNGQADIEWWRQVSPKLFNLELSYHLTTDLAHFLLVIDSIFDKNNLTIHVPHTVDQWDQCHQAYQTIKSKFENTHIQLLYSNFTRGNNQYLEYSPEQWNIYFRSTGVDPSVPEQVAETQEYKKIHFLNNYYGNLCWAGYDQIVIDNFGYVWRGWCKSNDHLGNIFDGSFILDKTPRPCPKHQCTNGFDLSARKSEKSWGMV